MRWIDISSTAIWVTGWDTSSVVSRAKSELNRSKCEWTRIYFDLQMGIIQQINLNILLETEILSNVFQDSTQNFPVNQLENDWKLKFSEDETGQGSILWWHDPNLQPIYGCPRGLHARAQTNAIFRWKDLYSF